MPRFDGTGPRGEGMFTGRGEGYCSLHLPEPGSDEPAFGYAGIQGRPVTGGDPPPVSAAARVVRPAGSAGRGDEVGLADAATHTGDEMANAVEVEGLTKVYPPAGKAGKPLRAVDGLEFAVPEGEVFGFLGPNGAGKTTTIRMLTGLARPTTGSAQVLGFDIGSAITPIKKCIGVVPEASNLYDGFRPATTWCSRCNCMACRAPRGGHGPSSS